MKRIGKLLLCLALVIITVFTLTSCAKAAIIEEEVDTFTKSGIKYIVVNALDADGNKIDTYAKVSGYTGSEENLTIPSTVEDIPVKTIASLSFFESQIKSLILPEGITRIENFALGYAENLISIEMPSTIEYIGDYSFINCISLKAVDIKATEKPVIGAEAFKFYNKEDKEYQVSSLLNINVPSLAAYEPSDVHDLWAEYQDNLEEA